MSSGSKAKVSKDWRVVATAISPTLTAFLESLLADNTVQNLIAVSAAIKGFEPFYGARYLFARKFQSNDREQCEYVDRLHLLGNLPDMLRSSEKDDTKAACLRMDNVDWYVARAFSPKSENILPVQKAYNPFGPNFILHPWVSPRAIDAALGAKYARHELQISDLQFGLKK